MKIKDFINSTNLDNSMLIGYYGGGNFGDELLMEVLLNLFEKKQVKNLKVLYLSYINYQNYHRVFKNCKIINLRSKIKFLFELVNSKNIIIGGGGIWGLDFNLNVFILSLIIFFSRFVLRKKIFLLGVGYYNSTTKLGRFAGKLVGFSSNLIIARDSETFLNFSKVCKKVFLDKDIVFNVSEIEMNKYFNEIENLEKNLNIREKTIFITIRRFFGDKNINFKNAILELVKKNKGKKIIISLFETKIIDTEGYNFLLNVSKINNDIKVIDFDYNPLVLLFIFKKNSKNIAMISPQFHGQIMAFLTNTYFLPITYDNKNSELFKIIGINDYLDIKQISYFDMQNFVDKFYE